MTSIDEEIEEVQKEIRETPYNKSTEQHIGRLKAKLARLKEEKVKKAEKQSGGKGYAVEKSGDATVILVGFPSVGKSTLINSLTGAESKVADYDFTTLKIIPGALKFKGANIQILDVPGIISGASEGRGRGREVISVLRTADLLLLMVDPFHLEQYHEIKEEIYKAGVRLNEDPPNVRIEKRDRGGLEINATVDLSMSEGEISSILEENGIINAEVLIREDINTDELIDAVMGNREYLEGMVIINKIDLLDDDQLERVKDFAEDEIDEDVLYISAKSGDLAPLKERIFEELDFIRVYLKPQGGKADVEEPMILSRGADIGDLSRKIHGDLSERFRYARVWGESADHPNQKVGKDHELSDGDIVSIIAKG